MILLALGFSVWATILLFSVLGNAIRTTRATAQLGEEVANIGIKKAQSQLKKIK